jgi:hypothetical protein
MNIYVPHEVDYLVSQYPNERIANEKQFSLFPHKFFNVHYSVEFYIHHSKINVIFRRRSRTEAQASTLVF